MCSKYNQKSLGFLSFNYESLLTYQIFHFDRMIGIHDYYASEGLYM